MLLASSFAGQAAPRSSLAPDQVAQASSPASSGGVPPRSSRPVAFVTDVMPVLSKAGCNAGACHGNANGKAGFKLSLRGESPELDYNALTRDQLTRRTNPLDPDQSLLLLKATGQMAHEGGQRFKKGSKEYQTLRQWIVQATPAPRESDPTLVRIEVTPSDVVLADPEDHFQIKVIAFFSDQTRRDVTDLTVFESANGVAKVGESGLVERATFGETTVLARFLHQQSPVRVAFMPNRPGFAFRAPSRANYIDDHVFAKLNRLRMNPSAVCSDEVFARRAFLDLLGQLPSASEARSFVQSKRKDKRARLVADLLQRPGFADFWALKWADLLRAEERLLDRKGLESFHHWIRDTLAAGRGLDELASGLLSARGSTYQNPAANFYRAIRDPSARAEAVAQVFLGVRLQCAQCHSHPFDRWTQDDYYDWASLFARVQYKVIENLRRDSNDSHEFKGEQVVFAARTGELQNPRNNQSARPRFLASTSPLKPGDEDQLEALARWLVGAENRLFARAQANRIWFHLLGRGLVEPLDDFRPTNPASHPELLEALASDLVQHRFDLRHLVRRIMASHTYQLDSVPNESNAEDEVSFSHAAVRRLTAEQLLDCQSQVVGVPLRFNGYPEGLRAVQFPGAQSERKRDQRNTSMDHFLETFGKPARLLTTECERSCEPTMGQAFQMISGPVINELLSQSGNRLDTLLEAQKPLAEAVEELYWAALTRSPQENERQKALAHIARSATPRQGLEDLTWSLLNSKEFLLRR